MLSLSLLKGYNIDNQHLSSRQLFRSTSCFNFSGHPKPSRKGSLPKVFFSIYQGAKILKAPTLEQVERGIRKLSQEIKRKRMNKVNIMHRTMIKQAVHKRIDNFYVTSAYYEGNNNNGNLNESNNGNRPLSQRDFSNETTNYLSEVEKYENIVKQYKKEKMNFEIGSLFLLTNSSKELAKSCSQVNLMKGFEELKKARAKQMKEDKDNELDNVKNVEYRLLKNKTILQDEYETTFVSYVNFLQIKTKEEHEIMEELQSRRARLDFEVNKLRSEVSQIRKMFQELVDIRNFIIKVKEQKIVLPDFFTSLCNGEDISNTVDKKELERYKRYLDINHKIFNSEDEFIEIMNVVEHKNMQLLRENEKTKINTQIMRAQYEEMLEEDEKYEKFIEKQIMIKEKELNDAKSIHSQLVSQRDSVLSPRDYNKIDYHKNNGDNNNKKKQHNKSFNRELLTIMKYKDLLKNYPVPFSLLYYKLTTMLNFFFDEKILAVNIILSQNILHNKDELTKLLTLKLIKKNEDLIRPNCLKLLRLFEKAILSILLKHNQYISNNEIKKEIDQLIVIKQNKLKIKNAEEQRKMLENKRIFEQLKIIEKNKKIIIIPKRKVQAHYEGFKKVNQKKKEEKFNLMKKEQPTFNDFISYDDDEKE